MMVWPDGEDFIQLVGTAVKDRKSVTGAKFRDALAQPDIVQATVDALETIVQRIDEHLEAVADSDTLRRREGARASHYDALVWYRTAAALAETRGT